MEMVIDHVASNASVVSRKRFPGEEEKDVILKPRISFVKQPVISDVVIFTSRLHINVLDFALDLDIFGASLPLHGRSCVGCIASVLPSALPVGAKVGMLRTMCNVIIIPLGDTILIRPSRDLFTIRGERIFCRNSRLRIPVVGRHEFHRIDISIMDAVVSRP